MEEGKEENNIINTIVNNNDEDNFEGQLDHDDGNDDGAAADDNYDWSFMKNEGFNNLNATGSGSKDNGSLEQGGQYTNNEWGSINDVSLSPLRLLSLSLSFVENAFTKP